MFCLSIYELLLFCVLLCFLVLADSDFWPDVQATTLSFTRLPCCFVLFNRLTMVPIFSEAVVCLYPILGHLSSQMGHPFWVGRNSRILTI